MVDLFGGAIVSSIPPSWRDVSLVRQVPGESGVGEVEGVMFGGSPPPSIIVLWGNDAPMGSYDIADPTIISN